MNCEFCNAECKEIKNKNGLTNKYCSKKCRIANNTLNSLFKKKFKQNLVPLIKQEDKLNSEKKNV